MILKFVVACSESTAKNLEFDQFWAEVCRSLGECSDQEVAGSATGGRGRGSCSLPEL